MYYRIPPPEIPITQDSNYDQQAHLFELLRVLLLHHTGRIGQYPDSESPQDWPSIYLIGLEFVSGEKSVQKSYMLLNLRISPDAVEHPAAETFTLRLSVERKNKC